MLFAIMVVAALILNTTASVVKADEAWDKGYTYNYDYFEVIQYCPDAYNVAKVFTSKDFGLDKSFNNPEGLYVRGDRTYLCDTGNNRILEFRRSAQDDFELVRVIEEFKGDVEVKTFNKPTDIFASEDGFLYICDKENHRILKLDNDLNYIMEFEKPTDETFDQAISFLPNKLAVDDAGRIYCIGDNVNKGMIRYENDGTFTGFFGATEASYTWTDYVRKKFATKEQRAAMESFVPTEYDNVYMDSEGFIFACTTNCSEYKLRSGSDKPVRRLNLLGNNILITNGNFAVIGDIYWGNAGGYSGPSLITDMTALDNGIYFILDKTRGRIFGYDTQGNLLYAFGGNGNQDGCFKLPTAIDHMNTDLLVLDSTDASFTLFTTTEFGSLIYKAIEEYDQGDYETSGATWEQVMALDGNYDLAYIGVGRALMRQGEYKEAMKYFRLKWDDANYSKAFKQYRKQWVEEHVGIIFAVIIVLLIIPLATNRIKFIKWQIDHEDSIRF